MARLPYLDAEALAEADRDLLTRPINLHRALVHSPNAARAFLGLGQFIRHQSRLDPRLRELAILQVGWLARSPYEWSHHVKIGLGFGVSEADIHALIADSAGKPCDLDLPARQVLAAAREITRDGALGAAGYAALAVHFDAERLTDLILTISFYNAVVRVLASLEIDVEPEYRPYLERFPLPAR
ncbi:MAG: carboxymuconolactone decarboxylase family protein [Rhodospirillales bacterium]|nr:carboxymuconolactone decarboxylase family protein [Rhodospirillales bacterium]